MRKRTIRILIAILALLMIWQGAEAAVAEAPAADGPVAETPAVDGLVAEAAAADGLVAEAPAADGPVAETTEPETIGEPVWSGLYNLAPAGEYALFTNLVDGYSLLVDRDMQVDMSYSSVCAVLENEDKRIEIYKEDVRKIGKQTYIQYSNRFLNNQIDHFLEFNGQQKIGKHTISLTAWSREKLKRVDRDKNHYVCIELAEGNYVYTIFIKAAAPVYLLGGYAYLVEAFDTAPATAPAYSRSTVSVKAEERGWNSETRWFYDAFFGDDAPLAWGIFEPKTAAFDFTRIERYEDAFSYTFPILLYYSEFQEGGSHPYLKRMLESAYDHGKVLELTLQTGATKDGGNQVYDVLNGEYDAFLQYYAETVADFQHPVLFRLGNEMNGDWCPYSSWHTAKDTAIYRAFYRYVYGFFERAEADNVIWVWNPNGGSYPDFKWNYELMYYPGDAFVDIVGMTRYNTGTYYSNFGEKWREFDELYDALYLSYTTRYAQPLMITEFASASMGGDKEQWVERMFAHIGQYPRIKAAVWWDYYDRDAAGNLSRSYLIEETQALMDIFRQNLRQSAPAALIGLSLSQDVPVLP